MTIPTINQLYASIIADLEAELNVTIPLFGRSYLRAKAMVQAGRLWLLYLVAVKINQNIFVDTCDEETLSRFGQIKIGRDRYAATQGQYTVLVTGTTGATMPAGTVFKSNDDALNAGKLFILDADFVLNGTNIITLRALEAGDTSKLLVGNQLSLTAPIPLVDTIGTVQTESIEPQAAETWEDYRQKVINAFRLEPQGGAAADYRLWATEVQGIVNAYPYAASGLVNTVALYIESDEPDGVPSAQDLLNVEASIETPTATQPSRKPITVTVQYLAVSPLNVDITITDYVDLTTAKETLIENALIALLADIRPFVGAIDVLADKNDTLSVNMIISTILSAVPQSIFDSVTLQVDGNTVNSFVFANGDIPLLNSVVYDY